MLRKYEEPCMEVETMPEEDMIHTSPGTDPDEGDIVPAGFW